MMIVPRECGESVQEEEEEARESSGGKDNENRFPP